MNLVFTRAEIRDAAGELVAWAVTGDNDKWQVDGKGYLPVDVLARVATIAQALPAAAACGQHICELALSDGGAPIDDTETLPRGAQPHGY